MEREMIDYLADGGLNRALELLHAASDQLLQMPTAPDLSAATFHAPQINRSAQRITSQ
jgi:hypothetical protein